MKKRWTTLLILAVAASSLVAPAAASASTTEAIADTGGMTLTIGILGSPLNVEVTVDEIGNITEVEISDTAFTEAHTGENKIRFTNEDNSTRIDLSAKKDRLRATIKATDLGTIVGNHTWSAVLFGVDDATAVAFDVIENADGYPELMNVSVTALFPEDGSYAIGELKMELNDHEAKSSVKITFTSNGYTMTLKIKVELEFGNDDDDTPVKLLVELKGKDVQKLADQQLADLVGDHNWVGRYCDGTPIGITYAISDTGDLTFTGATVASADADPDTYDIKDKGHGFEVRFADSDAKVRVELKQNDDGTWDLKVKSQTTQKCDHDDDDRDKKDRDHDDDDDDDRDKKDRDHDDDDHDDDDE